MLDSADDVVGVVSHDDRLADCTVRRVEPGWMELEISGLSPRVRAGQVLLVLVWPAVWRDPASLAPHLVRARSGNYGKLLRARQQVIRHLGKIITSGVIGQACAGADIDHTGFVRGFSIIADKTDRIYKSDI